MEKLIHLLNGYEEKENLNMYEWEIEWEDILAYSKFRDGYETINVWESIIISKWYEFIKRLVEHDKINRWKFGVEYTDKQTLKDIYIAWAKEDELLIMLLSISEKPIEFLISILK